MKLVPEELIKMKVKELRELAKDLPIEKISLLNKEELCYRILVENALINGEIYGYGALEILPDGYGFLRGSNLEKDIYISASQVKKFLLRNGDVVLGEIRTPTPDEKNYALKRLILVNGKELDIFIPELNIAIEFNGSVFHHSSKSENINSFLLSTFKEPSYHYNKWKTCFDNGVKLISIYDFYWNDIIKKEIYACVDKVINVLNSPIINIVSIFLFMANIGLAIWIGEILEHMYLGFFIVAGFYGVLALFVFLTRKIMIKRPVSNSLLSQFLEN